NPWSGRYPIDAAGIWVNCEPRRTIHNRPLNGRRGPRVVSCPFGSPICFRNVVSVVFIWEPNDAVRSSTRDDRWRPGSGFKYLVVAVDSLLKSKNSVAIDVDPGAPDFGWIVGLKSAKQSRVKVRSAGINYVGIVSWNVVDMSKLPVQCDRLGIAVPLTIREI